MESDLLGIGEMAHVTGLSVSALRFYDGVGVLVPVRVDPVTGYRRYGRAQIRPARLVAALRRVGMPLADIVEVLGRWPDSAVVRRLLGAHLRRLEDGLADARRELSRVEALLDSEENTMSPTRLTVRAADLSAALGAVRFAVGDDPDAPALRGVLLDVLDEPGEPALRLVATDRYRLAVAEAPAGNLAGPAVSAIAPTGLVDEVRSIVDAAGVAVATVSLAGGEIAVQVAGRRVAGRALDHDFPNYRRALGRYRAAGDSAADGRSSGAGEAGAAVRARVDVAALRGALVAGEVRRVLRERDGVECDVAVLAVDAGGAVSVDPGRAEGVGVNREFLLEALAAGGRDQLVLELDGPIRPLAVRVPGDERTFSVLMPTRLS